MKSQSSFLRDSYLFVFYTGLLLWYVGMASAGSSGVFNKYGSTKKKRALSGPDANGTEIIDVDAEYHPFMNIVPRMELQQRQADACSCAIIPEITYSLASLELYMAVPFSLCEPTATSSNLCPSEYLCVCQESGTSRCLPTTIAPNTYCTTYSGPSPLPPSGVYPLSSSLTYAADNSGQCGGTVRTTDTTSWNTGKTDCPLDQVCSCVSEGYSTCIGTTDPSYSGSACPVPCTYEFSGVSLPPPSATAKLGGQCGGSCWAGPTNCPESATCYTESLPDPGVFAMCHTTRPQDGEFRKVKLAKRYEAVRVPARVQARATPAPLSF